MSKLIAVWGAPGAGKTTFTLKLAEAIYEKYVATIAVVLADIEAPMLPIVCGATKAKLRSIGELLANPKIETEDVISHMFVKKERENVGLLGYIGSDNRNTYPEYDRANAEELIDKLKALADIVIVDCTSGLHDVLSDTAVRLSDEIYRVARPDAKSLAFMDSQLLLMTDPEYKRDKQKLVIMNTEAPDGSADEIKHFLGKPEIEIPYSKALRRQMVEGEMLEIVKDKRVRKELKLT